MFGGAFSYNLIYTAEILRVLGCKKERIYNYFGVRTQNGMVGLSLLEQLHANSTSCAIYATLSRFFQRILLFILFSFLLAAV